MFGKHFLHQWARVGALSFLLTCMVTFTFLLNTAHAGPRVRCRSIGGLLLDEHVEGDVAVAKMIGEITGSYTYTLKDSFPADAALTNLVYVTGTSVVETNGGTLSFFETSTQDTSERGNLIWQHPGSSHQQSSSPAQRCHLRASRCQPQTT